MNFCSPVEETADVVDRLFFGELKVEGEKRKRTYRTETEKQALLDAFSRSGITQREFCTREGISTTNMQKWRRGKRSKAAFVELVPSREPWAAELELSCGAVLRLRG